MQEIKEPEVTAFVGVSFGNHVIYNVVEREGEFEYTGMSIIHFLKSDKNAFAARIVESQNYQSIKVILDDSVVFGERNLYADSNIDSFTSVYNHMHTAGGSDYYYIYDIIKDIIYIKTPEMSRVIAVDFHSSLDVRKFINKIKTN